MPQAAITPYRPFADALLPLLRDTAIPGDAELAPWRPALRAFPQGSGAAAAAGEFSSGVRGEGLIARFRDLGSARAAFERSLVTAQTADLPLWRLYAARTRHPGHVRPRRG